MFKEIFVFELKQWLKRPGIYIYFAIFFIIAFLLGAAISGVFSGVTADTNSIINSSATIAGILTSFSSDYLLGLITILICVALMAGCVQKDFQYNCFPFYFTKPITKFQYLVARFSASFLLTVLVLIGLMLGLWLSLLIAPNENGQLGEFKFINFLQPFLIFMLPNVFMIGAVFFSLVTWTRNMTSGYVGSLVFLVIAGIARSITNDIDNDTLASVIDPFGQQALENATEYWTPSESNTRLIPFSGYILLNRLTWLGISFGLLIITYVRFDFNQFLNPVSFFKRKSKERTSQPSKHIQSIAHLPKVTQIFDTKLVWAQLIFLTKFEFTKITRSIFFYIIVILSVLLTVLVSAYSGMLYGTETWPVTYKQLDMVGGIFSFFLLILVIFYSGVVIWRERDSKVDELVGASPISSGILFVSKFLGLVFLCMVVNLVCIITCVFLQAYGGYNNFEIGLYIQELFGIKIFTLLITVALGVCLQVFFKNRYFGYFVMVIVFFGLPIVFSSFGYRNDLLSFNSAGPSMNYSDMNEHGHTLGTFFIFKSYWMGFMLILSAIAIGMYQRGKETIFKARWKQFRNQFKLPLKAMMIAGMFLFLGCGSVIYYNIRVLHPYKSAKDEEKETVEFEKKYSQYANELQPRVVESNVNVDIFPDELSAKIKGYYYLKNKNKESLKKIFININERITIHGLKFSTESKKFIDDTKNGFYGYELNKAMAPGDSIKLEYDLEYLPKNFMMKGRQTQIVYNGSFFSSDYFPSIGYNKDYELGDNATRKKYKLKPKPRMNSIYDTASYKNTYISNDADWIRFECVVSTKLGQTAIAPGYLLKDWKDGDRHYFHYKMDCPILNFYSFLSAKYEVKKDVWLNPQDKNKPVNIEIYYHKGHEYNIDRMILAIKKSLDYYTVNFSPYQHKQVRILEFPRYASFAQSFPNTIPYSESVGFIARVDSLDPEEVDYTTYVTAHEVAHQWWAHQVIGANVQGCTVMSETMSQYSALMVMEKLFGAHAMRKFLKYEMNNYLGARKSEGKKELPLILCENQQYIHYNKGSLVMYALKDYIGEDSLNAALRKYIKKVAFQSAPFTTSFEFYEYIKAATPDSLKETIADLFERIVVYDNGVTDWKYIKTPDGKYKITATLDCIKTRSDSLGKATEVKINDWIDIGVFTKNEKHNTLLGGIIYLKKMKITSAKQKIELIVDKEPFMFGLDPYNKLIDKDPGDNSMDKDGKLIGGGDPLAGAVVVKSE